MTTKSPVSNTVAFLICVAIPLAIGFLGSMFTMESVKTWYITINKPSFNPPNWIFAPVWTTLYLLMGIASFRVWRKRKTLEWFHWAVVIYIIQLVFNLMWSYIFFSTDEMFQRNNRLNKKFPESETSSVFFSIEVQYLVCSKKAAKPNGSIFAAKDMAFAEDGEAFAKMGELEKIEPAIYKM